MNALEVAGLSGEGAIDELVDDAAEARAIGVDDIPGEVLAGGAQGVDLGRGEAENRPARSTISMFAPSIVPSVRAPFIMSFMFEVPEASLPAVEICSEISAAG